MRDTARRISSSIASAAASASRSSTPRASRKDGRRIAVSLTMTPITDGEGHAVAACTIARDVTARPAARGQGPLPRPGERRARRRLRVPGHRHARRELALPRLGDACRLEIFSGDPGEIEIGEAHVDAEAERRLRDLPARGDDAAGDPRTRARSTSAPGTSASPSGCAAASSGSPPSSAGVPPPPPIATTSRRAEEYCARAALAIDNARLYREAEASVQARDEVPPARRARALDPRSRPSGSTPSACSGPWRAGASSTGSGPASAPSTARWRALLELVEHLLDVSRVRAAPIELDRSPVELGALVRGVIARFEGDAAAPARPSPSPPRRRWRGDWDRPRLERVASNLISNAVKYGAGQPIEVFVTGAADTALLVVRDHGVGIPSGTGRASSSATSA